MSVPLYNTNALYRASCVRWTVSFLYHTLVVRMVLYGCKTWSDKSTSPPPPVHLLYTYMHTGLGTCVGWDPRAGTRLLYMDVPSIFILYKQQIVAADSPTLGHLSFWSQQSFTEAILIFSYSATGHCGSGLKRFEQIDARIIIVK